jgi:hypothetical protein
LRKQDQAILEGRAGAGGNETPFCAQGCGR